MDFIKTQTIKIIVKVRVFVRVPNFIRNLCTKYEKPYFIGSSKNFPIIEQSGL